MIRCPAHVELTSFTTTRSLWFGLSLVTWPSDSLSAIESFQPWTKNRSVRASPLFFNLSSIHRNSRDFMSFCGPAVPERAESKELGPATAGSLYTDPALLAELEAETWNVNEWAVFLEDCSNRRPSFFFPQGLLTPVKVISLASLPIHGMDHHSPAQQTSRVFTTLEEKIKMYEWMK